MPKNSRKIPIIAQPTSNMNIPEKNKVVPLIFCILKKNPAVLRNPIAMVIPTNNRKLPYANNARSSPIDIAKHKKKNPIPVVMNPIFFRCSIPSRKQTIPE
jgi:hypothetical protein